MYVFFFTLDRQCEKLLPNGDEVTVEVPRDSVTDTEDHDVAFDSFRKSILLGVCYSANIGGTATLTGTATNLIFKGILEEYVNSVTFVSYFNG